ncbi:MAG TPA: hypothetical protein VFS39_10085 [Nitrospira sp.]|nr:hypothetical protein [Nitrospira sp.]
MERNDFTQRRRRATAMAMALTLTAGSAGAATLTWNANSDADLAGYRVYSCNQLPCAKSAGTARMVATLGKVTSFDIGAPAVVQYYILTAYDQANNESKESDPATYVPAISPEQVPPPAAGAPPPPVNLRLRSAG